MFDRLKKAFARGPQGPQPGGGAHAADASALGPVSEWAATQGFAFTSSGAATFGLEGRVAGRPWRMEVGRPSRKYIAGEELRARAELGLDADVAVVAMNRPLKELLEKQAYEHYTDALQTTVGGGMLEEVRWLAMFDEAGWDTLPRAFWARYAVLAETRDHAQAWIDAPLARQLLHWPAPAPGPEVPILLMLLRGKVYMRMQQDSTDLASLQHAALLLTTACENALDAFAPRA